MSSPAIASDPLVDPVLESVYLNASAKESARLSRFVSMAEDKMKHPSYCRMNPMTYATALSLSEYGLSSYEESEMIDFDRQIYFTGLSTVDKSGRGKIESIEAHINADGDYALGFDDEKGDYRIVWGDHLAYRFELVDLLGQGSFGQVARCYDHKNGCYFAVKIIRNKKRFHAQALVELDILKQLTEWDPNQEHHTIQIIEHFYFRGHLCLVTELFSINLYDLIKANAFRGFNTALIRNFATQVLKCLCLLQNRRLVHCDLKPENILLIHPLHSEVRVIDFGSSCYENERVYTYIQSRFYRSPEVILGLAYNTAIDMWSLGCILAELFTGYPIFSGENEREQMACIMEILDLPDLELINFSNRRKVFFDSQFRPRPYISKKGRRRLPGTRTLAEVLNCHDASFVDFVSRCLTWSPQTRMTAEEALSHPFITETPSAAPPANPSLYVARESDVQSAYPTLHARPSKPTPSASTSRQQALHYGRPADTIPTTSFLKLPKSISASALPTPRKSTRKSLPRTQA